MSSNHRTDPTTPGLLARLVDAQTRHQLFPRPPVDGARLAVVVGVSGGADSVALLHTLTQMADAWRLELHVAHLNHNLRPEAPAEAAYVAQLAQAWALPFYSRTVAPGVLYHQPGGLEAAARRVRSAFLAQVALAVTPAEQAPLIALAHHADDQAETVLLHLLRGSGLRGLGGMQWVSPVPTRDLLGAPLPPQTWENSQEVEKPDSSLQSPVSSLQSPATSHQSPVSSLQSPATSLQSPVSSLQSPVFSHLLRPFLGVRRAEIIEYLQHHGLRWCEDSSNQDQTLLRNRVRHQILPLLETANPGLAATLGRTAQILAAEAERTGGLDRHHLETLLLEPTDTQWGATVSEAPPVRIVLKLAELLTCAVAAQRGILSQALQWLDATEITFEQIETLRERLHTETHAGGPYPLYHNLAWSVAGATAQSVTRLSLHQADALPFAPTHPYLDAAWRQQVGAMPLPVQGEVMTPGGWRLQVERLEMNQLPTDWRQRGHGWRAYLDADQVGQPVLTTPRPGQRFAPLGMGGQEKTLGDFFTDRKTPAALRTGWPLVVDGVTDTVLWVCGHQPAHGARVSAQTRQVVKVEWVLAMMAAMA